MMHAAHQTSGQALRLRPSMSSGLRSGQALIVILLVLSVAATIVLSLISRTVTDVRITSQEKESSRAFSAAEAGIEEALIGGPASGTLAGGEQYLVNIGEVGGGASEFVWPQEMRAGDTLPLWLVSHDTDGALSCGGGLPCFTGSRLTTCWGDEGTSESEDQTPAIEVVIFYFNTPGDARTARVARGVYDPNSSRRQTNKFDAPDASPCTAGDRNFAFGKTILFSSLGIPAGVYNSTNGLQTARIRMLYNTTNLHSVGIAAQSTFPSQGRRISSVGTSEAATRRIEVFQLFADLPPVFDFVIFSTSSIVK